jgi:hypothetical protein
MNVQTVDTENYFRFRDTTSLVRYLFTYSNYDFNSCVLNSIDKKGARTFGVIFL